MKRFARLKTLLHRLPLLLLALAAPAARAATPSYYVAAQLPAPADADPSATPTAVAINKQGYILLNDLGVGTLQGYVYVGDHYVTLPYASLGANGRAGFKNLSNVEPDGSFSVVGEADISNSQDTYHRVIYWHVLADGTSTVEAMQNRVLGPGSIAPGQEQQSAGAAAVNTSNVIAGSVSSYLAGLGAFWYPPDITAHSDSFGVYQGPSDLDDAGNFPGERSGTGGEPVAQYNNSDLVLPPSVSSRPYELRNGKIVGEYYTSASGSISFVYDTATSTFAPLPVLGTATSSNNNYITVLGYGGEAAGTSNGFTGIWLPDPATGAYTGYDLADILRQTYPGYEISSDRSTPIIGFAGDGTAVVEDLHNLYAGTVNGIYLLKPGPDPRPVIVNPDPTSTFLNLKSEPGQPFRYQFTATNAPTAFRLTTDNYGQTPYTLPAGLSFDPATGLLSGTGPALNEYVFYVSATNEQGIGAKAQPVFLTSGDPPVITSGDMASGTVGQPFSFQITATNSPNNFNATSTPPAGLGLDSSTGLISGMPTAAGTFTFTYQVNNAVSTGFFGGTGPTGTLTFNIAPAPTPPTPTITSATTASGTVGVPFSYQITTNFTATNFDEVGLPTGLTLNTSTGLISGTPSSFGTGVFNVTLAAGDNQGDDAEITLTLTIGTSTTGPTPTPTPTPGSSPTPTPTPAPGSDDLGVTVSVSPEPVVQNALATFHVAVVNQGVATATGVKVYVNYGSGLTFVTQGSASVSTLPNNILSLSLADLPASGTAASTGFDLIFRVTATGGTVSVGATVSGDQDDSNPFNNNDTHIAQVNAGTAAAHAPTINAPAGGIILTGEPFSYLITTLGDVAVDSFGATGLPTGLSVDAATGIISGTLADDATPGAFSVTLSASNGAGRSTSTRTFTVVTTPAKAADVFATLTGLSVKAPTGDGTTGKYKISGAVSIANQGKKPAKNVKVGLYLSNSPDFSFPVVAGDPSVAQIPVFLDLSNPLKPTVGLTPAGSTVTTINLPLALAKKGQTGSSLGPVPFLFKLKAKKVNTAAAKYRYLLVVIDPTNGIKETNKTNNVTVIDLQAP